MCFVKMFKSDIPKLNEEKRRHVLMSGEEDGQGCVININGRQFEYTLKLKYLGFRLDEPDTEQSEPQEFSS